METPPDERDSAADEEAAAGEAAEAVDDTIAELEQDSEQLGEHIKETEREWESKRADRSLPSAPPRDADDA